MESRSTSTIVADFVIAEYSALRAEIASRISAQDLMVNLSMTATVAIFGFALSSDARRPLLLIIPALTFAGRLLYQNHNVHIRLISLYLDSCLRPLATDVVGGDHRVLGWEGWYASGVWTTWRTRLPHRAAILTLFPFSGVLALSLAGPAVNGWWGYIALAAGCVLVLCQLFIKKIVGNPTASSVPALTSTSV